MNTLDDSFPEFPTDRGTRPAHEIHLGRIKAVLWPNRSETGTLWYSIEIGRLFKDGATWTCSPRYRRDDLPLVPRVADRAFDWISAQDPSRE